MLVGKRGLLPKSLSGERTPPVAYLSDLIRALGVNFTGLVSEACRLGTDESADAKRVVVVTALLGNGAVVTFEAASGESPGDEDDDDDDVFRSITSVFCGN